MKTWNVPASLIGRAVAETSASYGGNLRLFDGIRSSGRAFSWRVTVVSSRGAGASVKRGRRIRAACWHTYRDVLSALFCLAPDARVKTAMADYRGIKGFRELFPATGLRNIGSVAYPENANEACDCVDNGHYIGSADLG